MIAWLERLASYGLSQRTISTLTGIPRISLYRYSRGLAVPSAERLATVRGYAWDVQYKYLRSQGASVVTAKRFMRGTIDTVDSVTKWIDEWAKNLAFKHDRPEEMIRLGLAKSRKSIEEIERGT